MNHELQNPFNQRCMETVLWVLQKLFISVFRNVSDINENITDKMGFFSFKFSPNLNFEFSGKFSKSLLHDNTIVVHEMMWKVLTIVVALLLAFILNFSKKNHLKRIEFHSFPFSYPRIRFFCRTFFLNHVEFLLHSANSSVKIDK